MSWPIKSTEVWSAGIECAVCSIFSVTVLSENFETTPRFCGERRTTWKIPPLWLS